MTRSTPHAAAADLARRPGGSGAVPPESRHDYGMYGLRVRSEIPLPDWPAASPGDPQVVIVQEPPSAATFEGARYNARSTFLEGEVQLEVRGVARYSAEGGSCIRVGPEPDAKPEDVLLYLTGAMFGIVLHQRGILPLHASCVALDGTAVAFAAPSGSGKSSLLAALVRRGATFVSDDICALTPIRSGAARVWPGAPRLKLDQSGMAALRDGRSDVLEPAGGNRGKYHVPVRTAPVPADPLPLRRVYLLQFGSGAPRLERLDGLRAISALLDETYMLSHAVPMGLSARIFRSVAELSATLTTSTLVRPRGFEHLDAVVDLIEGDVRGGP